MSGVNPYQRTFKFTDSCRMTVITGILPLVLTQAADFTKQLDENELEVLDVITARVPMRRGFWSVTIYYEEDRDVPLS